MCVLACGAPDTPNSVAQRLLLRTTRVRGALPECSCKKQMTPEGIELRTFWVTGGRASLTLL